MPSFPHEALAQVFRDVPGLLPELLKQTKLVELPRYDGLSAGAESLGDAIPRELRCDTLLCFQQKGQSVLAAIVEVQLSEDPEKLFTWPAYVASARLRYRCDVILVVLTLTERVARWASRPISFGPGAGHIQPLVIGPDEVPVIADEAAAQAQPDLALVSAIAHASDPDEAKAQAIGRVAHSAAQTLVGEKSVLYTDFIYAAFRDAGRTFAMLPPNYELQNPHLRRAWNEGKAEGKAEGEAKGKAEGVLAVLQARGLPVAAARREQILACTDGAELDRWLKLAATAASADALFAH